MTSPEDRRVGLQERDLDILTGLFECRVMSLAHISDLYFEGRREAAKKRVQRLKRAGYLMERPRCPGELSILHIGKKAFKALSCAGRLSGFPEISLARLTKRAQVSAITLRHELEVMDVRAAFFRAVRKQAALIIREFTTWPVLSEFTITRSSKGAARRQVTVKPDGFVCIQSSTGEVWRFFLEVDRSTESSKVVTEKIFRYLDFYRSGGMALRCGGSRSAYKSFPFRVILVCKSESRRMNLVERLLQNELAPLTQVWLTTIERCRIDPFDPIWVRTKDLMIEEGRSARRSRPQEHRLL